VDASVGVKLFVAEALSARADRLFAQLAADPPARLYVPDLFFIECTNILWKYVRRFGYHRSSALRDVRDLSSLPLKAIPTARLAPPALELAIAHGASAYDAAYVALGQGVSLPVVTADEALVRRFGGTGLDVRHLADWPS
jgi:predicted nucleic acid-binding protein